MAINYSQWIAFARYSYKQLRWAIIEKPEASQKYVQRILDEELNNVLYDDELLFDESTGNYLVVFE